MIPFRLFEVTSTFFLQGKLDRFLYETALCTHPPKLHGVLSACDRSLVDILRHQSSPVQHGERNNMLTTADGRPPKNLYTPILQSKDNRSE